MSAYFDINSYAGLKNLDLNKTSSQSTSTGTNLDLNTSPSIPTEIPSSSSSTTPITNEKHFERCLSEDLLSQIFAFFTPAELLLVSLVNRRWRRMETNNDGVEWNVHLTKFWSSFNQNVPTSYLLLDRISNLSLTLIKRALFRVDTSRCVEKREYQRMLIARLLFNDRGTKRGGRVFYPEWALRIGQHKASLFQAMKDMKRRDINISELCAIQWRFHFKQSDFVQVRIIDATGRYALLSHITLLFSPTLLSPGRSTTITYLGKQIQRRLFHDQWHAFRDLDVAVYDRDQWASFDAGGTISSPHIHPSSQWCLEAGQSLRMVRTNDTIAPRQHSLVGSYQFVKKV